MPTLNIMLHAPDQPPSKGRLQAGTTLGRSPKSDLVIGDANASGSHALIVAVDDQLMIEDVGSSNGTHIVGGKILRKGDRHPLSKGLQFIIGKTRIEVTSSPVPATLAGAPSISKEAPLKPGKAGADAEPAEQAKPVKQAKPAEQAKPVKQAAADGNSVPPKKEKPDKKALPEIPPIPHGKKDPEQFTIQRYHIDLTTYTVKHTEVTCTDFEDVLGGAARGFKLLEDYEVQDPYAPSAPLILNLGCLSGSQFMTGLRTYFHGYSPLKASVTGAPSAMWSAGSGKFGTKLRTLGIDEVIFTGRAVLPVTLHIDCPEGADGPRFTFENAEHLLGQQANQKIQHLYTKFPDAHFAVIGPAGENYDSVRYAAIALSTVNQLKSGDMKSRFCGRGGFGGVMGSKNLLGIVANVNDQKSPRAAGIKELNKWVARGEGSRRFRDAHKGDGGGGTWANMIALDPLHAMPEFNFEPTGGDESRALWREAVEKKGDFLVKDEACFACGIACHKNLYESEDGKKGKFRAKFDYEPLNLLSSNIGIYDIGQAAELVELVDDLCMDSISIGGTLSYAMEYNRRCEKAERASVLPSYIEYGNFAGALRAIEEIGNGRLALLGQGSKRLSEALGETGYAMHCKGVEFPAYMPQVNPGYPWALAGGHMSMKTYLLYVFEKESGMDYWVEAITERGPLIMRDDLIGICKFAALDSEKMVQALHALSDLNIDAAQLEKTVMRTFLRGYRLEKKQGFDERDYVMPAEVHEEQAHLDLPHFNTSTFFGELQARVSERLDKMLIEEAL